MVDHPSDFGRLVLGWIDADFRNQIFVGKLVTKSTRFTSFFTSPVAKLQPELAGEVCVAYFNLAAEYEHLRKWTEPPET